MDGNVMLLWLRYLKQLERACAAAEIHPEGAAHAKTMCEDEEWGPGEAAPGERGTPSSGREADEPAASSGGASPASAGSGGASPPRLRLNASLATDPALAPHAVTLKREPAATPPPPPPPPRDYLALTAAAAAFPALFPAAPAAPPYVCQPCGIRYSSLSTLQAHQEHYCSNRRPRPTEPADSPPDAPQEDSGSEPRTPRPPGKQYACAYCSYSADKKVSLNRHMRMHSASPAAPPAPGTPAPAANGDADPAPAPDRYCTDCDIRFSSSRTYRAHKAHYCSTRQVVKPAGTTGSGSGSTPGSPRGSPPAPQYALALPTTPILVVPYSLLRGASALPGATLPHPDAPCFLLPNGTFQPLGRAAAAAVAPENSADPEVLKSANRLRDTTTPLDLSVRRSPASLPADDHEKENKFRAATPEQIVCAPSLPGSPGSPSPPRRSASPPPAGSPKRRRRVSPRDLTPKPSSPPEEKFAPPPAPSPALALRLAAEPPAVPPQILVKQGSAKCKECNIVFCKFENYQIHKRHYCSAGGAEERASPAPDGAPPPQYRQMICLACGIHFSSLDNLTTHQSYYCTKRETRSPRGPSGGGAGGAEGWRCPCCDVVSATAAAAQRHMEAHAGVKAFRCTICRYRGNTLRGMRTHIRMHFPKKPADLQEESYIACVIEEEGREASSPHAAGERVHRCGSCAYTSTYRGNVVRHARIVHATPEEEEEPTPPPVAPIAPVAPPPVDIKKEPGEPLELDENTNYCKSCDISFKYVNTFKAHKQFYCTANTGDAAGNNNVPPVPTPRVSDTPVL